LSFRFGFGLGFSDTTTKSATFFVS